MLFSGFTSVCLCLSGTTLKANNTYIRRSFGAHGVASLKSLEGEVLNDLFQFDVPGEQFEIDFAVHRSGGFVPYVPGVGVASPPLPPPATDVGNLSHVAPASLLRGTDLPPVEDPCASSSVMQAPVGPRAKKCWKTVLKEEPAHLALAPGCTLLRPNDGKAWDMVCTVDKYVPRAVHDVEVTFCAPKGKAKVGTADKPTKPPVPRYKTTYVGCGVEHCSLIACTMLRNDKLLVAFLQLSLKSSDDKLAPVSVDVTQVPLILQLVREACRLSPEDDAPSDAEISNALIFLTAKLIRLVRPPAKKASDTASQAEPAVGPDAVINEESSESD